MDTSTRDSLTALGIAVDGVELTKEQWNRPVSISMGWSAQDNAPGRVDTNLYNVVKSLEMTHGDKDGRYITQGVFIGDERSSKYAESASVMLFDIDSGQPLDEIVDGLENAGAFGTIWATYSHGKSETVVATKALKTWLNKKENAAYRSEHISEQLQAYLVEGKGYRGHLFEDELLCDVNGPNMVVGTGEAYTVVHPPMSKYRVLLVLDKPFLFSGVAGKDHADREKDWKDAYASIGTHMGFDYDISCADPARLMYLPRAPKDSELHAEDGHEVLVISGSPVSLDEEVEYNDVMANFDSNSKKDDDDWKPVTPGLFAFLKATGPEFDIVAFMIDSMPEEEIRKGGYDDDLVEVTCPNEPTHTGGRRSHPGGSPMFVWSAGDTHENWGISCRTDGCTHEFGGDRAKTFDAFIQGWKHNPPNGDAVDLVPTNCMVDLITKDWAPEAYATLHPPKEEKPLVVKTTYADVCVDGEPQLAGLADAQLLEVTMDYVDKYLDENSTLLDMFFTLNMIARSGVAASHMVVIDHIKNTTKKAVKLELKSYLKKASAEFAAARVEEFNESYTPEALDFDKPVRISHTRDLDDMKNVAIGRLMHVNNADPFLFRWMDAPGIQRMIKTRPGSYRLEEMKPDIWANTYSVVGVQCVRSIEINGLPNEQVVSASFGSFQPLVREVPTDDAFMKRFPMLTSIVNVPVFDATGRMLTEEGYSESATTYLLPGDVEFASIDVDNVTKEDAVAAWHAIRDNALRDFPFSDSFDGVDPLPVGSDDIEVLDDGTSLAWPNLERGKSSRANFLAMLLQFFVRPMIKGACPIYHIDKSEPATGANYLANVLGNIIEGTNAIPGTLPDKKEEVRKNIMTQLMHGAQIIFFDNIHEKVDDPTLASVTTSDSWRDRALGGNDLVTVEVKNIWLTAGNNVQFSDELVRRCCVIRLDAATADPSTRTGFKIKQLSQHMREFRLEYIKDCHTICAYWIAQGCPKWTGRPVNSYEAWSEVMGGILECVGEGENFMANADAFKSNKAEERDEATVLLEAVFDVFGAEKEFTRREAFDQAAFRAAETPVDAQAAYFSDARREPVVPLGVGNDESRFRYFGKKMDALNSRVRQLPCGTSVTVREMSKASGRAGARFKCVVVKD